MGRPLHGTLAVLLFASVFLSLASFSVLGPLLHRRRLGARVGGAASHDERFDADQAQRLLLGLCVGGPRVTGSSAAASAVETLERELASIGALGAASGLGATLVVEAVNSGEGSFETDFLEGFTDAYQNITSVVARLSWPSSRPEAVLLASHFDSFPGSPGASDDVTQVAAAVGVLRALAAGPPLAVSVLAFFSGSEESNWVAAHGFATSHRWAADYHAVINLEAIGARGDHVVFQVGPNAQWLTSALASDGGVPPATDSSSTPATATTSSLVSLARSLPAALALLASPPAHVPRGSVIAHDIFQIPGFPAGSDFKTLLAHAPRAQGPADPLGESGLGGRTAAERLGVTGLDLATLSWGYAYHTPLDQPSNIGGTQQLHRLGAGLLAKVEAVAGGMHSRLREIETEIAAENTGGEGSSSLGGGGARRAPHENDQTHDRPPGAVFFDLYGTLWVSYSSHAASLLHASALLLALLALYATGATPRDLGVELLSLLAGLIAATAAGGLVAVTRSLATFGAPLLTAVLFSSAALSAALGARGVFSRLGDGAARLQPKNSKRNAPKGSRPVKAADTSGTGGGGSVGGGDGRGGEGRGGKGGGGKGAAAAAASDHDGSLSRRAAAAALAPWLLALLLLQGFGLGSAYLPALFLGSNGAALLLATGFSRFGFRGMAGAAQTCGALPPALHALELCGWLLDVLLPITGRLGVVVPSDAVVALVVGVATLLPTATLLAPLTSRHAAAATTTRFLLLVLTSSFAVALLRPGPFTETTPKRLLVQHLVREVDGVERDAGLWISAYDAAGLRELRNSVSAAAAVPAIAKRNAHACDLDPPTATGRAANKLLIEHRTRPTGCYLSFPFYFPLGGVLGAPDGDSAVYATRIGGRRITPPPIPDPLRVRVTLVAAASSAKLRSHRLLLRLTGPSHMAVVVPENRIAAWAFGKAQIPRPPKLRRSPFAPSERLAFAFLTCGSAASSAAPVVFGGDGGAPAPCAWDLVLEVNGSAPLELAVYGHYTQLTRSEPLELLSAALEPELRGDWHWFSSMLQRVTLPMPAGGDGAQ